MSNEFTNAIIEKSKQIVELEGKRRKLFNWSVVCTILSLIPLGILCFILHSKALWLPLCYGLCYIMDIILMLSIIRKWQNEAFLLTGITRNTEDDFVSQLAFQKSNHKKLLESKDLIISLLEKKVADLQRKLFTGKLKKNNRTHQK
jgi:uncharacterized membrane protein